MNNQRPGMFVPALIGGAVAGVLTGIPIINCLCCLWIIGGGTLAAYFLSKDSPAPISPSDGAIVGVFAGIVAAFTEFLISIPLAPVHNAIYENLKERLAGYMEEMPAGWETWMEQSGIAWSLIGLVINAVIFAVLGALGGILGAAMFKKKFPASSQGVIDVPKDQIEDTTPDNRQS